MAIDARSTTAPARPLLALVPFAVRPAAPVDDVRTPELPPEPLLPAGRAFAADSPARIRSVPNYLDAVGVAPPLLPAPAPLPSLTTALSWRRAICEAVAVGEPDTAAEARAFHAHRELHRALEWGFALLDALDLGPATLDEIDHAIRVLDALDAPGEDLEPYLAGTPSPLGLDVECDSEEYEGTALESFGRGFVRAGADDAEDDDPAEDSDPAERDDHHGAEDEPYQWRFETPDAVQRAAWLCEVAHV